jgi:predicted PurR-regulated permease PerM
VNWTLARPSRNSAESDGDTAKASPPTRPPEAADQSIDPVTPITSSTIQVRNVAFTLVSVAIVILLLQFMQSVLIPFVLAALLFYALDPTVDWLQKQRVPRAVGAAFMLVVVVAACGALTYSLQGQALTVIDQLPAGARKLANSLRKTPGTDASAIEKVQQAADALHGSEKPEPSRSGVMRVQVEDKGFQRAH